MVTFLEWNPVIQTALLFFIFLSLNKNFLVKTGKFAKVFIRRSLVVIVYHLAKLFPRDKQLIVFGAENGNGFRGNPKYLFLEAIEEDGLRCVWVLKNKRAVKRVRQLGYEAYYYHSLKGIFMQLRAKTFIHSHSIHDDFNRMLLGGATSINTWHGVGLKKVWGANKRTFTYKAMHEPKRLKRFFNMRVVHTQTAKNNYVISTSERVSSYYPETFLVSPKNVLQMGQARNDVFFYESDEEKEFPEYIKREKIITYMPTHRNHGKKDTDINDVLDFKAIDAFCETYGYKFLVKRHMYSNGHVSKLLKHVIDVSHDNLDPQLLLKYTDILITDYSSCYTDYLLLDRPVVFYCYDLEKYLKTSNEMYYEYDEVTPGPHVREFEELLQTLTDFASGIDDYKDERERVLNIFYAKENQGRVAKKQWAYLRDNIIANGGNNRVMNKPEKDNVSSLTG